MRPGACQIAGRGGAGMDKQLIETLSDGVATLTLNRPDRLNALSTPIMDGLLEALPRLAGDPAIGAIVLTGAGRAFCAGGDVKRMAEEPVARSSDDDVARLRSRMEISRLLHEIPKPTIAMVNGAAAGAGLAMALACDLRFAGQSARFVTAFRSEEHTSELQSHSDLVCRLLLEKKKDPRGRSGRLRP